FVHCVLLRRPWRASPSLSYLYQFAVHKTEGFVRPIPLVEALGIWWLGMRSQWGALLLLAMGVGLIYFVARRWWGGLRSASRVRMAVLALTCAGGMTIVLFMPPMFRLTGSFAPFLYLFASFGIVGVLRELGAFRAPAAGIALAGALGAAVGAHQVSGAWEVYQSYLGFSDSLDWVSRNCHGHRVLFTFNVSDPFSTWKDSPEQLMDTCLVSPAPLWIFGAGPAHAAALKKAKPLRSWPSYWGTENAYIELKGFGNPDWRNGDLNSAIRVY